MGTPPSVPGVDRSGLVPAADRPLAPAPTSQLSPSLEDFSEKAQRRPLTTGEPTLC